MHERRDTVSDHEDVIERPPGAKDEDEMQVVLVRIADSERRVLLPSFKKHYAWADQFWWTGGNMGCECNRHLEWFRVNDLDIAAEEFGCNYDKPKRYYVILRAPDYKNPVRS